VSALRISTPDRLQLIDQGPALHHPLRGRGMVGHAVRPAAPIPRVKEPLTDQQRTERNARQKVYRDGLR